MKPTNIVKRELPFMKHFIFSGLCLLTALILIQSAHALKDPSQVYCTALGYTTKTVTTAEGSTGMCVLPSGEVDAWKFLRGEIATEYSYCKKMNYEIKTINDSAKCIRLFSDTCAVCVLSNGTEVEVTELMGLSFAETTCGDGVCGIPENYKTCPQDCPSGSYDGYCDGVADGKCDPDCVDQGTPQLDPDCPVCGNVICETSKGENYTNCPQDCPKPIVCGNGICESGENQTNCCKDCGCQANMKCVNNTCISDTCGNGVCDNGENYTTCPQDCPFVKPASKLPIYIAIAAIIGILVFIIFRKSMKEQSQS